MTHKLNETRLIHIETDRAEYCHRFNGAKCDPVNCIGAEVFPKDKTIKYIIEDGEPVKYIPHRRIVFYCMPQPREIILSE